MGWNTYRLGDGAYYAKNTAHPSPSTNVSLYAVWGHQRKITHQYPTGYYPVYPGILDPYDRAVVKPGEKITLSGSLYFERNPWHRPSPVEVYKGKAASLAQKFLYWRDISTDKTYFGPNDTFTMPDRNVNLEAVYDNNIGTFEFWNWVGGTTFTYHIRSDLGMGDQQASSAHYFGYWGKVHYPPYPVEKDFSIYIHSSWSTPPWYGVLVTFKNGKTKWHNHSKSSKQSTLTLITAEEIANNGGGLRHVKILAANPGFDWPVNPR